MIGINTTAPSTGAVAFTFPYPYARSTDIKATVAGSPVTPVSVSGSQVTLNVTSGQAVVIYRDTDVTPVATFNDGVSAKAAELNTAFTQCISIAQEAKDAASLQTGGGGTLVGPTGANQYIRSFFNGTAWVWQAISLATLKTDLGVGAGLPALPSTAANIVTVAVGGASYALSTPAQVLTSLGISTILLPTPVASRFVWCNGSGAYALQDAAAFRTSLGLAPAATTAIGTAAGNLVALNGSAKIPGSLIDVATLAPTTPLPRVWVVSWTGTAGTGAANPLTLPMTSIPVGSPNWSTLNFITGVASNGITLNTGYYLAVVRFTATSTASSTASISTTFTGGAGSAVSPNSSFSFDAGGALLGGGVLVFYLNITADNTRVNWVANDSSSSKSYAFASISISRLT